MVGRGLRRRIVAVRLEGIGFAENGIARRQGAIDLVGRDVQKAEGFALGCIEALPVIARACEQAEGADDVGRDEVIRAVDRPVDMGLGGKVDNCAGANACKQALYQFDVTDVAADECEPLVAQVVLMAIGSASDASTAYLFGKVINQAYIYRSVSGIVTLSAMIIGLFTAKGLATYWQSVILSRISNAILAHNQRRLFAKLMQESVGFYSQSHSSEYLNRLSAGASSITQVLSLIVTTAGRDLLSLIGLVVVMVSQDPLMSLLCLVVAPPLFLFIRKIVRRIKQLANSQFISGANIMEAVLESLQGIRTVKALTLEEAMTERVNRSIAEVEAHANKWRVSRTGQVP